MTADDAFITVSPERMLMCERLEPARSLAILTRDGIRLWCRNCRRGHLMSWSQLEQARFELQEGVTPHD